VTRHDMIIIGEKINATRKAIARAIRSKDAAAIQRQIQAQDAAGAGYIDLNAGADTGDADREIQGMRWLIDVALDATEKPLSIDSANPEVIQDAAEYLGDRRPWLLNSVKKDARLLDTLLPLAARHEAPVIALAMDSDGIPEDAETRIETCREICEVAGQAGVPADRLFFDPLVMPVSSNYAHGQLALDTLRGIRRACPEAKTTVGASNISFGLLKRSRVNAAFLIAAAACGLDSAICDPTEADIHQAVLLSRLITGQDRYCRGFNRAVRRGEFDE